MKSTCRVFSSSWCGVQFIVTVEVVILSQGQPINFSDCNSKKSFSTIFSVPRPWPHRDDFICMSVKTPGATVMDVRLLPRWLWDLKACHATLAPPYSTTFKMKEYIDDFWLLQRKVFQRCTLPNDVDGIKQAHQSCAYTMALIEVILRLKSNNRLQVKVKLSVYKIHYILMSKF